MDFFGNLFLTPKGKKDAQYTDGYKKYLSALKRNPQDGGLRTQFIKYCLVGHFTLEGTPQAHLTEALEQYDFVARTDHFDPQTYYLVGRYFQEKEPIKAQKVYLAGVQHFNRFVEKNPGVKGDFVEITYAIALNYVTMQYGQVNPDLEKFFNIIRKSYPLHNKRIELENELRKSPPNPKRIKEVAQELQELKDVIAKARPKRPSAE